MTPEQQAAMRQALESLEQIAGAMPFPVGRNAITALRQALEQQPADEPVAWRYDLAKYREGDLRGRQWMHNVFSPTKPYVDEMVRNLMPLYTRPQPAAWVGLTTTEFDEIHDSHDTLHDAMWAVIAKLREKNGGKA